MLVAAGLAQDHNRRRLETAFRSDRLVVRVRIDRSRLSAETVTWADYWRPAARFFGADTRLVHRLNHLKSAWRSFLKKPKSRRAQATYCWRYFGLLHHALRIACREPGRGDPLPALRRILGFEVFTIALAGQAVPAAALPISRNPVYLLGRLPSKAPLPSPRHVPLLLPIGEAQPFYYYRQITWQNSARLGFLISPATELKRRPASFGVLDRFVSLLTHRPDPYWRERGRLLSRRVLGPLLAEWVEQPSIRAAENDLRVLDLGSGTGRLVAEAWREARRGRKEMAGLAASIHCVDAAEPCVGRSLGLGGRSTDLVSIEWSTADYRQLLDDDAWLAAHGPFDWAVLCRILDNASNFLLECVPSSEGDVGNHDRACPSHCLAPRNQRQGVKQLSVATRKDRARAGTSMPQFSLADYFAAMRAVMTGCVEGVPAQESLLPVRRFNPASLTTYAGCSIFAQLIKSARVIIIEDVDLMPNDLLQHKERFGLEGTAAICLKGGGFATVAQQYVVGSPTAITRLQGQRLW